MPVPPPDTSLSFLTAVESPRVPIGESLEGELVTIAGVIRSVRVAPWVTEGVLEAVVADCSGRVTLRFTHGSPPLACGDRAMATGMLVTERVGLVMVDPAWRVTPS
jgi:hypothetical protein